MYFDSYAAGYRIQKLRKAHGLTQEEAAIKLNISDRHMRSLEKGTYTPLDLFVEIAVHFDVTLDYLILGKVETKKELELGKKIHDQKQIIKSFGEQLLAFAMEIEAE
jgi:transcriptional regulator with XRE-family HTH domain